MLHLLRTRRFLPLFATQALGALVDNIVRNAVVVLVVFADAAHGASIVALAGGLFILPYVVFAAPAGLLADRMDKARLIRISKFAELALMLLSCLALLSGSEAAMLGVLCGLGVQATFFGPLKYAILPEHLGPAELLPGNALVEAGTFAAILLGTILGGVLASMPGGAGWAGAGAVLASLCGLATSWFIPPAPPSAAPAGHLWNLPRETMALLRLARASRPVWNCSLGIGWFWTLGAVMLAQLPVVAARILQSNGRVVTLMVAMFTLGIGAGSLLAGRLRPGLRGILLAGLGLSLACADFAWGCAAASPASGWNNVPALLGAWGGWRLLADLLLAALCGGVFSVPLYTRLQRAAEPGSRARAISASNLLNAACMAAGSALAALAPLAGMGPPGIILVTALGNVAMALWVVRARID